MGKERTGALVKRGGVAYIRVQFTDSTGRHLDKLRKVKDIKKWRSEREEFLLEIEKRHSNPNDASRMKFSELAEFFTREYMTDAVYSQTHPHNEGAVIKIAGYRGLSTVEGYMRRLRRRFDAMGIAAITYEDLRQFKLELLSDITYRKTKRSLASTHRHLSFLRRVLRVAERKEWITKSPFAKGEPLINLAAETSRQTLITRSQEVLLLEQCVNRRAHLRPILIFLLDTGCRKGEAFKLVWGQVSLDTKLITILSGNTKTLKERQVGMTTRVHQELTNLYGTYKAPDERVFGILRDIRKSFKGALKDARLESLGLRGHDLRHSAGSRIANKAGVHAAARVLGHSQLATTFRYINTDDELLANAVDALEEDD